MTTIANLPQIISLDTTADKVLVYDTSAAVTGYVTPNTLVSTHTHAISDVTGLQTALDAKLASSSLSSFGLTLVDDSNASAARTTLGLGTAATSASTDFAAATHNHTSANITDFNEAVDDRVSALLVAGSNVTLTYNDAANTLTVAATASAPTKKIARAIRATNQTGIGAGAEVKVQFNSETFDDGSLYDATTNFRYVADSTSKIRVTVNLNVDIPSGQTHSVKIYKNGSAVSDHAMTAPGVQTHLHLSDVVSVVSGDYLEIYYFNGSSGSRTIYAANNCFVVYEVL